MSADKGNIDAIYKYSFFLYEGLGVEPNKIESAKYLKIAADDGNDQAMIYYATMLENGDGIPVNLEEAVSYFKKAAEEKECRLIRKKLPVFIK